MARYREIKKYAGMWVIKLLPSDEKDLNFKIGDLIDLENISIKKGYKKIEQIK